MAACVLDGDKLCEVAGDVKWSSVEYCTIDYYPGSLALYKLSSSFYIHGITATKRAKVISVFVLLHVKIDRTLVLTYCSCTFARFIAEYFAAY